MSDLFFLLFIIRPPDSFRIGAGFVGSHFTRYLLKREDAYRIVIFDNFSSGKESYYG